MPKLKNIKKGCQVTLTSNINKNRLFTLFLKENVFFISCKFDDASRYIENEQAKYYSEKNFFMEYLALWIHLVLG